LISKSPYQFNGTIEYQNVIILREFILKNAHSSIKQIFNTFTTTTTPIEGNNPLYIGFENEIGHTAVIRNTIVLDRRGPIATVELKGGVGTAIGPRPVFTVLFNEPAKIRDVFVISADVAGSPNASRLSIVNDYNSNLYYLKHNFTMNEDLPTNGRYDFGIETEDEHGNVATVTYFGFNYENDPLTITLVNPEFLVSPTAAIEFTVATNRDSTCKFESQNAIYDVMRNFAVSGEQNHSVPITLSREHEGIMYYVKCNDGIGNVNEENPAIFNLSYDTSAPSISSIGIDPGVANVVIEYPLSTRIVATANEQVRCRYGEISSFESMDDFDNFTLPLFNSTSYATRNNLIDDETYTYVVICQNRAKLLSASTNVTFSVDLSQAGAIQVLSPKSGSYHTELDIPIKIKTTKRTLEGNCKWGTSEGQVYNSFDRSEENEHIHVKDSNTFPTGSNTLYFECVIEGERKKTSASFTIDMTPPAFNSIDDGDFSWNLDELSAVFNFTDNESGISKYEYAIGAKSVNGANPVEDWQSELEPKFTSSKRITVRKLDLQNLANYYWAVRAYNKAGLHTDWHSSDGVTIDTSKAPVVGSCTDGNKNQDETDIDCGGLRCTPCSEGWACVRNEDCMGRVCADGMCASGECSNGLLDGNETDVDCGGGLCSGCDLGKNCSQNLDCLQRYCNVNVCEIPACDDSVLNGWETDIDCGGDNECMRCAENSSCLVNSDCYSNLCGDDGLCLPTSCSDNIFNGDETDVDCGGSCDNCADNKGCSIDTDCSSDYCRDGRCTDRDLKDSDSDGMPDWWEIQYDLNPNDPSDADMEALAVDGMSNLEKYDYKNNEFNILGESLDPTTKDYDGDGHLDTKEIKNQTDATNNHDYPKAKWWSILLFILAIIIVGGSLGYFGYNRYIVKHKTPDVQPRVAPRQQGGPQMPKPAMKMPAKSRRMTLKEKLRLALKNKVIEERKEVLAKEHAKMLSGFGMEVSQKKLESARTLNTKIKSLKQKIKEADIDSAPESSDVEPEKPPMSPESAFDSINKYTGKDKVVEEKAGNIEKLALLSKKSSAPGKAKETIDKDGKDAVDRLTSIVSHTQKKIENNENKTDAQKKVLDKLRKIERKKSDKK